MTELSEPQKTYELMDERANELFAAKDSPTFNNEIYIALMDAVVIGWESRDQEFERLKAIETVARELNKVPWYEIPPIELQRAFTAALLVPEKSNE
jgi:hypothetical protein